MRGECPDSLVWEADHDCGGGVDRGVVRVRLQNVCNGCPSTIMTVIMGIEQELRRHVPEVEYLEAVY